MIDNTISSELGKYAIGQKLRRLRLNKRMGLVELGRHTSLSPALLSKLERDIMHPTLPTLVRIALVFSVGLEYFFHAEPKPVLEIVRRRGRLRFPDTSNPEALAYHFESLDFPVTNRALQTYFAEFGSRRSAPHEHAGVEFIYVLSGKLQLLVGAEEHQLAEGDAVYFDSGVPHSYRKGGSKRTTALVVSLPARSEISFSAWRARSCLINRAHGTLDSWKKIPSSITTSTRFP